MKVWWWLAAVVVVATANPVAFAVPAKIQETFTAKVVNVSDGDTVKVYRLGVPETKVRLLGIDAPEKNQPFGQKAKEALNAKVAGKVVIVEAGKPDRYGRLLARLKLDGKDVNLSMVEEGWAWHYAQYARSQYLGDAEAYAAAQGRARSAHVGLWADTAQAAVPPWEFRAERKVAAKEKKANEPKKKKKKRKSRKHRHQGDQAAFSPLVR